MRWRVGRDGEAIDQDEDGLGKIDIEQRFGRGEFEDAARLKQPVEALLAQIEEMIAQRLRVGIGSALTGNSAYQREPAGRASMRRGHLIDGVALARACRSWGRTCGPRGRTAAAGSRSISVEVATVERGLRVVFFWRMAMAGAMPSISSTVGLLHALQELAGVGGERFDVAALAFGVDGVEGQRGFAGPGDTGDYGELVVRESRAKCS